MKRFAYLLCLNCLLLITAPVQATFAAAIELTDLPGIAVSANSFTSPGGEPENAIDNKDYLDGLFSWVAGDHGTPDDPNWLQLDFGSDYYLANVEVRGIFNEQLPWFWGYNNVFNLWAQQDSGAWVAIGDGDIQDSADPALRDKTFGYLPGAQPLARYLRYEVVGGSHWSYLGEINVQGTPFAVPEPSTLALAAVGILGLMVFCKRRRSIGSAVVLLALAVFAADARQLMADVLVSENLGASAYSASGIYVDGPFGPPEYAFDGTLYQGLGWNAGNYPMQWLEVDLQQPYDLTTFTLYVTQLPDGDTTHEIWVSNSAIQNDLSSATLIHTFSGFTFDSEILTHTLPSPVSAQFVQVRTTESESWVGWWEVQVFAVVPEPSSAALLLCGLVPVWVSVRRRRRTPTTKPPGQVSVSRGQRATVC